jgi:hypothetical protein
MLLPDMHLAEGKFALSLRLAKGRVKNPAMNSFNPRNGSNSDIQLGRVKVRSLAVIS